MSLEIANNKHMKDPEAVLDYAFNWRPAERPYLGVGENITTYTITPSTGITLDKSSEEDGLVTVWLSGGKIGETYRVACLINTDGGRTDERSMWIKVVDR